jgi:hypothetical protein
MPVDGIDPMINSVCAMDEQRQKSNLNYRFGNATCSFGSWALLPDWISVLHPFRERWGLDRVQFLWTVRKISQHPLLTNAK